MTTEPPPAPLPQPVLDYSAAGPRPTRARYGVLAFLCGLALLLYVDRVCIGQAASFIRDDLGLSLVQMGWVFNAFTLAYCLFEVPTGHWADRHGSRGVIARIVVWWSAFTALTGAAFGLWSLVAIRFLFGAGEAGAYPNAARVVTRWFPAEGRGFARGAITFVSFLGAAAAPVLAAALIGVVGWRLTFVVFGAVGIVYAIAFYVWFRDNPAEHPAVNAAELTLIRGTRGGGAGTGGGREADGVTTSAPAAGADPPFESHAAGRPTGEATAETSPARLDYQSRHDDGAPLRIPWGTVLTSPNTWLLGTAMTVSAILFYMQFQWYPTYLKEARAQGEMSSGWMTAVIMFGGAAGCVAGGLLADFVYRRTAERRWSRRLCGGGSLLLAALSVLGVRIADSAVVATLCNAAALFFVQMAIPTWWAVVAEISGRHGASMWGLMNSMAGLGLMAATPLAAWFVQSRQAAGYTSLAAWGPVFDGVAVGLGIGAVCWLMVDATRSIVGDDHTSAA